MARLRGEGDAALSARAADRQSQAVAARRRESEIDADANVRIEMARHECEQRVLEIEKGRARAASDLMLVCAATKAATEQNAQPELDRITAALSVAQERSRAQQQAEGTRKAIEAARREAETKRARSKVLTAALGRLDELKQKVAAGAPIPGVMFENGRIVREEAGGLVPLSHWNTASQYQFCLRLGMLLGGGFVCVDHFEAFTRANQRAILEAARAYAAEDGVQFLFGRVNPDGGALRISPVGPGEGVSA